MDDTVTAQLQSQVTSHKYYRNRDVSFLLVSSCVIDADLEPEIAERL